MIDKQSETIIHLWNIDASAVSDLSLYSALDIIRKPATFWEVTEQMYTY